LFLFISIPILILILILPITVYLKRKINSSDTPNESGLANNSSGTRNQLELKSLLHDHQNNRIEKANQINSSGTQNELENMLPDHQDNQIKQDIETIKVISQRILKTLTDSKNKEISIVSKSENVLNEISKTIKSIEELVDEENQSTEIIEYFKKKDIGGYKLKDKLGSGSYGSVFKLEKNNEL